MILVGFYCDYPMIYFCFGRFRQRLNPFSGSQKDKDPKQLFLNSLSKSETPLEDMEKSLKSKYLTRTYIKTNHAT